MTSYELNEKLNNLKMTEEEINCIMKQYDLLASYEAKDEELDAYKTQLEKDLQSIEDESDSSTLSDETQITYNLIADEVEEKVESKRKKLFKEEETAIHEYYANAQEDINFDISKLKLSLLGSENISGVFLLYRLQRWSRSKSPRLAKFIYFEDDNPIIFELDCSNAKPSLIVKTFNENYIFINSFYSKFISLYLQILIGSAFKINNYIVSDYCYDELGFVDNDYTRFYASRIIGNDNLEQSFLVGEFTNYVSENGSFDEYMDMLKKEVKSPRLQLGLTLGVMSPLNYILHELNSDINNVVINLCGMSSKGKTTVQKLATSVFAKPEIGPYGLFLNSNSSLLAMVRSFANCNGMLFCVDDLTRFSKSNRIDMETLIYTLEAGQSKAICKSTGSVIKPVEFHGTVITSSERLLAESSFKEGASVRINEFCLDYWTSSAENSENICRVISDNYGLLGPKFMKFLLNNYSKETIYNDYHKKVNILEKSAEFYSEFNRRLINKLAIILLSAEYLKKFFDKYTDYKFSYSKIKKLLIEMFNNIMARSNDSKVILRDIVNFYNKNKKFFSSTADNEFQTYGKLVNIDGESCLALTNNGKNAFRNEYYALDNSKLTSLYNADYLLSEIDHVKSNTNYSKRVSFRNSMFRCTVVKINKFNI